jgi:hypothetical protein
MKILMTLTTGEERVIRGGRECVLAKEELLVLKVNE